MQRDRPDEEESPSAPCAPLPMQVVLWVGDELTCLPADSLPAPAHVNCGEGCAACCPPAKAR